MSSRFEYRARRTLVWALLLSLVIHLLLWPYLLRLLFSHAIPPRDFGDIRTATTITHLVFERPARRRMRPLHTPPQRVVVHPPVPIVLPRAQAQPARAVARAAAPRPHQVLRFERRAPARLTPQAIARQERLFAKTIADAKAANDPIRGATAASVAPEAPAHYAHDYSSITGMRAGQGYLTPVKMWKSDGYDYYYVRYRVTYADGTNEEGVVPWPIRFPPKTDPFLLGIHQMPLPGPPAGFSLPAGTELEPLVRYCYDRRPQYCPIDHGP